MRMADRPERTPADLGTVDPTFVHRNEITSLQQERQGHINHIALLKATLKSERIETEKLRERVKALEEALLWNASALQHATTWDDECSTIKLLKTGQEKTLEDILDEANALLEGS